MEVDKDILYKNLPTVIKSVLILSSGWLVGGSIRDILADKVVKDFDIIVPNPELFQRTNQLLILSGYEVSINSFGGLKFKKDIEIDLWVCNVEDFLINRKKNLHLPIFNLKHNVVIFGK